MAQTGTDVSAFEMDKDTIETAYTFADAVAEAEKQSGVTRDNMVEVLNPYEALNKDKSPLLDKPFFVRHVKFQEDATTHQQYLNMWVVTEDNKLYRVTDGSTGIYEQMKKLVEKRLNEGHKTPYNFYFFPGGLRKSDFGLDADNNAVPLNDPSVVSKATTYYLA